MTINIRAKGEGMSQGLTLWQDNTLLRPTGTSPNLGEEWAEPVDENCGGGLRNKKKYVPLHYQHKRIAIHNNMEEKALVQKPSAARQRMTRLWTFLWSAVLFCAALMPTVGVQASPSNARDYFRDGSNYDAYSMGQVRIHFKVLVFAEGSSHNNNAGTGGDGSRIWTRDSGSSIYSNFIYYASDNYYCKPGMVSGRPNDKGWAQIRVTEGIVVVTNAYNGDNPAFQADNEWHSVDIRRNDAGDHLTYLEFDWYLPDRLYDSTVQFQVGIESVHHESGSSSTYESRQFLMGNYRGAGGDQQPQLVNPIFYTANGSGMAGYGMLAVPYVSFQQPYRYYTSWNPAIIPCNEQSGMIYVPSCDSVQHGFYITMETRSSQSTESQVIKQWQKSSKVNVPAYHKIYDIRWDAYTWFDSACGYYLDDERFRQISWKMMFPHEEDIVPNDAFEIQRAYQEDFSDAQTIATIPIQWATDSVGDTTYVYVDSVPAAWYNPVLRSRSIFYRVRRVSAALWGWDDHPYAASIEQRSGAELLSIDSYRSYYTADSNFDINHKTHIYVKLKTWQFGSGSSASFARYSRSWWDRNAKLYVEKILDETHDTILIRIPDDTIETALWSMMRAPGDSFSLAPILHIEDQLNTPCIHYRYRCFIDTTGVILLPQDDEYGPSEIALQGTAPYFTDAAGLNSLEGTHGDYPDKVVLTWTAAEGGVDEYVVETRPNMSATWAELGRTQSNYWIDHTADPSTSPVWQYRVTMNYTCQGSTVSDSRTTTGARSPWGHVSGRVHYEDGTGCPGVHVVAVRNLDSVTVQQTVTDANGSYRFDSLPYGGNVEYSIFPTSQTAQFRYHQTSPSATVNLSLARCIATDIDFDNISSVRLTGRVLYENSTIPVRDAGLLLDGQRVLLAHTPLKTDASGNFELRVPSSQAFTLQVVKEGHHFADDGYLRIGGDSLITRTEPLDGVRMWDQTKVRLAGRVAGGIDQQALPLGFGLSTNNLGDNLKLVLELEGDNVSHIVHVPTDLTKDTLEYQVPHLVYPSTSSGQVTGSGQVPDTVGWTKVHYQLRRIIIEPDSATGEYCADLFPVRYKVSQATATGYSTLFGEGRGNETLDLSAAATHVDTVTHNSQFSIFNSQYKLTYRSPISITCKQTRFGMDLDYFGEESIRRPNIQGEETLVPVACRNADGSYRYLFGAPVFKSDWYDFRAFAHEDYYYNNDINNRHDQVRIKGGTLTVYNGMYDSTNTQVFSKTLDTMGQAEFSIPVNYAAFTRSDTNVLRVLDLSVESNGEYIESQAVRAYVTGNRRVGNAVSTHGHIQLLDVLRDPPGSNSSAFLESGSEYSYSYTFDFKFKFGIEFGLTLGSQASVTIGAFAGLGAGMFTGQNLNISTTSTFSLPITSSYNYKHEGNYTFRTSEQYTTSNSPYDVGQSADIYLGLVQNVYYQRTDAVQPIDSLTYAALAARSANGTMPTIASGTDTSGNTYYLVIGSEIEVGPYLDGTFAYTHNHIENTLIPQLMQERDALLLTCDSADAQVVANQRGSEVYWSRVAPGDSNWAAPTSYRLLTPAGSTNDYVDEVDRYNRLIADWVTVMIQNEAEKVSAIHGNGSELINTYSVSNSTTVNYSNEYSYSNAYHVYWDYPGASISTGDLISNLGNAFGSTVTQLIGRSFATISGNMRNGAGNIDPIELLVNAPGSATRFLLTPIIDFDFNRDPVRSSSHTRRAGFTLSPDVLSHMDVSVYRMKASATDYFNDSSDATRHFVDDGNDYDGESYLYGSLVYYLRGGATKCPCEVADSTHYYTPKTPISAGSMQLENPRIDIDVHERSNVPVDRPAIFTLRLYNELEQNVGPVSTVPIAFTLRMNDLSNPHGARVYIDGMPLTDGRTITLLGSQVVTKTMEVYAGDGYDFEDLVIELVSTCISSHKSQAQFSVHFMPVSCPVTLTEPHNNWVINTLSAQDSQGYYRPVTISDFDVNYRNFDHIELQYKLSTQSNDSWVNLCSFYADSTLYAEASGTKAMIEGGRIDNVRFYGERDPIEQRYDLRAVSFCRHGNGFITRTSEVRTGTKDTRCPRVFGQPLPANSILGVGDNLVLRFNEPIAGNYLDADNNFQLVGGTNRTGIASGTSVHFDGTPSCGASSAVTRVLSDKSFSIDLMAKPYSPTITAPLELFGHSTSNSGISFGIEPAGEGNIRLYAYINDYGVRSIPLEPITAFRRLVMTYNYETRKIEFYAGTECVTDTTAQEADAPAYEGTAPLVFGHGFRGDMLEARLWIKALSQAEIVETHEKRLTGYERKLAAYYPMNEGRGATVQDKANGATLSLHGASWTSPSGYSLYLNGTQAVTLDQNILARSVLQDYTLMFWFRTSEYNVPLFSAGRTDSRVAWQTNTGTLIAIENGRLTFRNGNMMQRAIGNYANGLWHHYVLTVNRTYNNASIYVDGQMVNTFSTDTLSGLSGVMYLGGVDPETNPPTPKLRGHIDDMALFEQALPRSLVEAFDNISPQGDEMGLIALLPFSEQRENSNGILEEVFSTGNQRLYKAADGSMSTRVEPLILAPDSAALATMADHNEHAPARQPDLVSKIDFDWSFNNDELLININMRDHEINKNNIYITVRNVEDLNGNRTVNPIMWQVYVNKNTLVWNSDGINEIFFDRAMAEWQIPVQFRNTSGRRHQYTIEGLPDWLHVNQAYGSINPEETLTAYFTVDGNLPIGDYSEIIYLTDEDSLAEPLKVFIQIKAVFPWTEVDGRAFEGQMSLRGQVLVDGKYDSDPEDVVVAIVDKQIVGMQNIAFDDNTNTSLIYLTIYGNSGSQGKPVTFRLWQASTGRVFNLTASETILYQPDTLLGIPPHSPIILATSANEVQKIDLYAGWNWISFNLKPDNEGNLSTLFFPEEPFDTDDQIKSAATLEFAEYNGNDWTGTLTHATHKEMYMVYTSNPHFNTQMAGCRLTTDADRTLTFHKGWNSLPYLLDVPQTLTNAMADYYDHASVGDLIKSQDAFAIFSENRRWEGSLTALEPGTGYLLRRVDTSTVRFTFHGSKRNESHTFTNLHTHTLTHSQLAPQGRRPQFNMTLIAATEVPTERVFVYVGGKLAATAEQIDSLFFITIPADESGLVTFALQTDTGILNSQFSIHNSPNAHHGTPKQPVLLTGVHGRTPLPTVYPTVFTDQINISVPEAGDQQPAQFTLRDALGREFLHKTLNSQPKVGDRQWSQLSTLNSQLLESLPSGVYFATITYNNTVTTIKLIKK